MRVKAYRQRKWMMLAAMTCGATFQLSTCREDLALLGLRTLFTSFTLPFNQLLRDILLSIA